MSDQTIEARFFVAERHAFPQGKQGKVILRVVSRGDQNRKWSSATPSGQIEMSITNPAALDVFDKWLNEGCDVAVTFTPVIPASPTDGHVFRPALQEPGQSWPGEAQCGDCGLMETAHTMDAE